MVVVGCFRLLYI